jgi:hypothetical protein
MILHSTATINFQKNKLVLILYAWLFVHIGILLVKKVFANTQNYGWLTPYVAKIGLVYCEQVSLVTRCFNMKNGLSNKLDKKIVKYIMRNYKNDN